MKRTARPKSKSKNKTSRDAITVPCLRVVIGGKPGATGRVDGAACAIVGENRGSAQKFDLNEKIGATSKTVSTPQTNRPCLGVNKRKTCPVQLVFDRGRPFLRFCTENKKPGYRIDISTPSEAAQRAAAACETWRRTGRFQFPPETPLASPDPRYRSRPRSW